MFKKFINTAIAFIFVFNSVLLVKAANLEECKVELGTSLETVMGIEGRTGLTGYLNQLQNLTSTNMPVNLLIEEVEQLARDARVEMRGICNAVDRFGAERQLSQNETKYYVAAYDLCTCAKFKGKTIPEDDICVREENEVIGGADQDKSLEIVSYCWDKSDELLDVFLDSIKPILLEQAIRTSMEPVVQTLRALNERLVVLLNDYSKVVNNFFTFSFRLGDTITGEWD